MWREDRIRDLLSADDADVLFLGGCSPNQGKLYPRFDHVVLLTAPVIVDWLAMRTNNPYGKRPDEVAHVPDLLQSVEPVPRRDAGHVVDTGVPLTRAVAEVLLLVEVPD